MEKFHKGERVVAANLRQREHPAALRRVDFDSALDRLFGTRYGLETCINSRTRSLS